MFPFSSIFAILRVLLSFVYNFKAIVDQRYKESKGKAKTTVAIAPDSLTLDIWTSINTDAYLAACHFIDSSTSLLCVVLGELHFPNAHTANNLSQVTAVLILEWGIADKVTCFVTDCCLCKGGVFASH